jgi:transposase
MTNTALTLPLSTLSEREQLSAPFAHTFISITRQEYIQLKREIHYYKELHQRGLESKKELEQEVERQKAKVRDLNHRLYGKKTEKSTTKADLKAHANKLFIGPPSPFPSKRGAQAQRSNRARKKHPYLPIYDEDRVLPPEQACCPDCGMSYHVFPKTEDSDIVEVEVKAYIRRIHRTRYKSACQCPATPALLTAPVEPRVYPKASLGISTWTLIILDKYQSYTPSNRLYQRLDHQGISLAAGTVTGGLKKIAPLFAPINEAMKEQQRQEKLFHNDETGWKVFEAQENKVGYRWYLWVTRSASVILFTMDSGRSAAVPEACFEHHPTDSPLIIVCDRYSAYKKFAKGKDHIILAFCWAHVRRDFLDAARRNGKKDEDWMFVWIDAIGGLYQINNQRIKHWDETKALDAQSSQFQQKHQQLTAQITQFKADADQAWKDEKPAKGKLVSDRFKVLNSLQNHWEGLTVFVKNPQVPMDNNTAEQAVRMPVAGRRSFYGSGSIWSAHFAAILMGWIKTLLLWELNPYTWMRTYLQACADNGSVPPDDLSPFLPWLMDDKQKAYFARPYQASTDQEQQAVPMDIPDIQDSS